MLNRIPMLGLSTALARVSLRQSSTLSWSKFVSMEGPTRIPRREFDSDNYDHIYPAIVRNTLQGNFQFATPAGRRMSRQIEEPNYSFAPKDNSVQGGLMSPRMYFKQNSDAVNLYAEMPGVDKKDVKVYLEGTTLVVEGVRKFENDNQDYNPPTYSAKLDLSPLHTYKVHDIKADLEDGVLKVTIPKAKHEERTDILHVQVN